VREQVVGRPRIFISYSSGDTAHAERLVSALLLNGLDVWWDRFDIGVGEDLHEKVVQGLVDVDYVGVLLTANSLASAWVKEELSLVKQRELEQRDVILLPLLFEHVELPLHLRKRKYADFTDFDAGLRELLRTLGQSAAFGELDEAVRRRVQEVLSIGAGRTAVAGVQELRSQLAARLVRTTSLRLADVEAELHAGPTPEASAVVFVDIKGAGAAVPVRVDLEQRVGHLLARVVRALGLDDAVEGQRVSFFLIFEDQPLEVDEQLSGAGVVDGDHLELGVFTYLIE
jgi:hypothetical protein